MHCPQIPIAACLEDGPLAESGHRFLDAAHDLGASRTASALRAWCVAHIFRQRERIFDSNEDPVRAFDGLLRSSADMLESMAANGFAGAGGAHLEEDEGPSVADVEAVTGSHYGNLFKDFSAASYWNEAVDLLRIRLERNGVDVAGLAGKSVLDAGCGGGRYTGAWRLLGAAPAVGLDISPINIEDGKRRAAAAKIDNLQFEQGNVLSLPYARDSFDIVFSNGVLHHTTDWRKGIAEVLRVLKPGGLGWLYLIEKPGGLFWDSIEILRRLMHGERADMARATLRLLGLPANRIFYMLDHVMVPINVRLTPEEIEAALAEHGAAGILRLKRGADFDRIERIYQDELWAVEKYGAGENRFIFSKG